eukprot:3133915-Pleurochrysis_carterae.AAC.1
MVQAVSHFSGETFTTTSGETRRFCIRNLPGLFSDGSVSVFDTSLIPDIRVTLYWSTNAVLSKSNGVADGDFVKTDAVTTLSSSYTNNDCFMTIDSISIAGDAYSSMIDTYMKMGEEQCLTVSFPDYTTVHDSAGSIIRFSTATNSMDRVMALWCTDSQTSPVPINGSALAVLKYDSPTSSSSDKLFQSAYVNSALPSNVTTLQLTCNSSQFPQHEIRAEDLYFHVKPKKPMAPSQFNTNYALFCHQFCDNDKKIISGVDTHGSNFHGFLSVNGSSSACTLIIESTSVLRIYPGRQFKVER